MVVTIGFLVFLMMLLLAFPTPLRPHRSAPLTLSALSKLLTALLLAFASEWSATMIKINRGCLMHDTVAIR